jgi:hypothetical protein
LFNLKWKFFSSIASHLYWGHVLFYKYWS